MCIVNNGCQDIDVDPFLTTCQQVKIISTVWSWNGLNRCSQWSQVVFHWLHASFPTGTCDTLQVKLSSCFDLIHTSWGLMRTSCSIIYQAMSKFKTFIVSTLRSDLVWSFLFTSLKLDPQEAPASRLRRTVDESKTTCLLHLHADHLYYKRFKSVEGVVAQVISSIFLTWLHLIFHMWK